MKAIIKWAVDNAPAMNTLMLATLVVGTLGMVMMRREVFPEFELEIVLVSVPYPGASPEETEQGICQKLEEAMRSIDGIKKQTAVAQEGAGFIVLEIDPAVSDVQKIVNDIRSEVDRIPGFPPELAEEPEVQQITFRMSAIKIGLIAPEVDLPDDPEARAAVLRDQELALRSEAERLREEMIALDNISQATISGSKQYQIDVELPEEVLRKHGLSLQDVARVIRRENVEMPGGNLRSKGEEIILRGKNKRMTGSEIAEIQVLPTVGGDAMSVRDLGVVRDGFDDTTAIHQIDGRPALVISVERTSDEDLFLVTDAVHDYVAGVELLPGYQVKVWGDESVDVRERMDMLIRNGVTGLLLVFIVLAIFLEIRLAFWVAMGIPISILGSGIFLFGAGQTLNMLSMFAFLMALGIVVDDAIVIGENIYQHREMGKSYYRAAVDGAYEVLPSVVASVGTTVIAFAPLLFVSGVMGKFIAVMPLAVIAMLIISLLESTFILPCHLAHKDGLFFKFLGIALYPLRIVLLMFERLNVYASAGLAWVIERVYSPILRWSTGNPYIVVTSAVALLLICAGVVAGGFVPFEFFPKLDGRTIQATVRFPNGTPSSQTDQATRVIEDTFVEIAREYEAKGMKLMKLRYRNVGAVSSGAPGPTEQESGGHVGKVSIELVSPEERNITSQELIKEWRQRSPTIPGVDKVKFDSPAMGPGGGSIEFKMLAPAAHTDQLIAAADDAKEALNEFDGVSDIDDDMRPGKTELQLRIKDRAKSLGVTLADLSETVRATYYGDEAMRIQRGRHEVKIMVRYPPGDRRSITDFEDIRVRTQSGVELPITALAEVTYARGAAEINRVDQQRSITVTADVDSERANSSKIIDEFRAKQLEEILKKYPQVRVRWEGQTEQRKESFASLGQGVIIALLAMYVLLTIEFRSYLQPLLIMAIIPFGAVGAIGGHFIMGLPLTLFSFFGLVALTGVVVNDSIVLIDFINARVREGMHVREAVVEAGRRRFRPVLLTSVTTVAGLLPMLTETSFQAQLLVPMANSLCFGLILATLLILVMVPVFYLLYYRLVFGEDYQPSDHDEYDEPAEAHTEEPAAEPKAPATTPPMTMPQHDVAGV